MVLGNMGHGNGCGQAALWGEAEALHLRSGGHLALLFTAQGASYDG
jgi:hypothetical protein